MAENTLQFHWIVTIKENLDALFDADPLVFVAGDLFWYPVEGQPKIVQAPDIFAAFGRPKGYRGSYMQWVEGGIAPQVVFEILSPGNRPAEITRKFQFYEKYQVEEYYVYNPDTNDLSGWLREGDELMEIPVMNGWISPRLGIRFELTDGGMTIYRPDNQRFMSLTEMMHWKERVEHDKARLEQEKQRAEQERQRAQQERESALRITREQADELHRLRERLKLMEEKLPE